MPRVKGEAAADEDLDDEDLDEDEDDAGDDQVEEFFSQFGPADEDLVYKVDRVAPETIHGVYAKGFLGESARFEGLHTRDDIERAIAREHGGGRYKIWVYRGSKYAGAKTVPIAGAPKLPADMMPQAAPSPGSLPPSSLSGQAPSAALELAGALRSALEPQNGLLQAVLRRLDSAERSAQFATRNPAAPATPSPELESLRAELKELRTFRDSETKRRELAEALGPITDQLAELKSQLQVKPKKPKKTSPFSRIDEDLTSLALFAEKMDLFRRRDEENGGGIFSKIFKRVEKRLEPLVDGVLEEAESFLQAKARELEQRNGRGSADEDEDAEEDETSDEGEAEASAPAPTPQPPPEDAKAFGNWLQGIMQNPGKAQDAAYAREGLAHFPQFLGELVSVREKGRLVTFIGRVLGFETAKMLQDASEADLGQIFTVLSALRATVESVRKGAKNVPPVVNGASTAGAGAPVPEKPDGGTAA